MFRYVLDLLIYAFSLYVLIFISFNIIVFCNSLDLFIILVCSICFLYHLGYQNVYLPLFGHYYYTKVVNYE